MRRKKVLWLAVSRRGISLVVLTFGLLGLLLSLQLVTPAITVTGGHIGRFGQMLLDMLEFAQLGI